MEWSRRRRKNESIDDNVNTLRRRIEALGNRSLADGSAQVID